MAEIIQAKLQWCGTVSLNGAAAVALMTANLKQFVNAPSGADSVIPRAETALRC